MAALRGRLCIAGRVGRQPAFARTDQLVGWDCAGRAAAGAELVRRYLRPTAPSSPAHLAEWAGIGKPHARELWALADTTARPPPRPPGVRLLAPGDPLLLGRDREALLADPAARKKVWSAIPGTGVVLSDGEPIALWKARKQGKRLEVTVDGDAPLDAVLSAAERLAPHRNCTSAVVR